MKVLCHFESCASHYIYAGLGAALQKSGHEFRFWFPEQNSFFDICNEYQPDVYLGQSYHITRAEIKWINNHPELQVLIKAGIWGDIQKEEDVDKYTMLIASDEEKSNVDKIEKKNRLYIFNYGFDRYKQFLVGGWSDVCNTFMLPLAADTNSFYPEYNADAGSDIGFVGGYWGYKAQQQDKYILQLCYPVGQYNIRIYGNQVWPCPQFNGFVSDRFARQVLSSCKIIPACHEPHAVRYGFEAESRIFNSTACNTFTLCDNVETYKLDVFTNDELPMFDNPKEYKECIDYYLRNDAEREELAEKQYNTVINGHTYNHRVKNILEMLNGQN